MVFSLVLLLSARSVVAGEGVVVLQVGEGGGAALRDRGRSRQAHPDSRRGGLQENGCIRVLGPPSLSATDLVA